ncbi:MAG: hypothetical protein ACSHW2_10690, partial [Parasphingopyxis sp.]
GYPVAKGFRGKCTDAVPFARPCKLQVPIYSGAAIGTMKRTMASRRKRFIYKKALFIVFDTS